VDFVVAHHEGNETWEELGAIAGASAASAFSRWVDTRHGVDPGEYGVRQKGTGAWQLFVVDRDGLHPVDHF
jgi:hypothetical protein